MAKAAASFWQVFRVIFVLFSLYLLGDAFFRWDGFSYYATFSEFLPALALITILWSIVAVFAALLIWLPGKTMEWLCRRIGWKVKVEHLLLFILISVFLVATVWFSREYFLKIGAIVRTHRVVAFFCVSFTAIFLTWLFRNKMAALQERITPLVWIFGIWLLLSVPLVAYWTLGKQTSDVVSQEISTPSVADKSRPNIVLVIFDALTARDMSVYGYNRPTTPFISEWAKTTSLFERVQAESTYTTPTTASLMTGKRLWTHQIFHPYGSKPVSSEAENLPLLLKKSGYHTMAFIVNSFASPEKLGIANGFDIVPLVTNFSTPNSLFKIIDVSLYRLFGDKIQLHDWIIKEDFIMFNLVSAVSRNISDTSVPPENAFNSFLSVIDNNSPEPFFAWIHLYPPHEPYLPPEPYMGMFDSSLKLRTFKSQLTARFKTYEYQEFPQEIQSTVNTLRARYDEFIRYCDKEFENFIAQLKSTNKLKNTVIIFSADHGESFEHNYLGHGEKLLYEQLTHIPLIIKEPNQTEGRIINELVEQIDIAPTILSLADIPVPSWMEGRSLVPLMRGKKLPSRPVFSMEFVKNRSLRHQITKGTIAVWEDDYKLIHYLEENESLLFNLKEDPDELNNLFEKEAGVGQRLLNLIQDNLKKANEKIRRGE